MSVTTSRPLRVGGADFVSGNINTGELNYSRGGSQTFAVYSGWNSGTILGVTANPGAAISGDLLLYSGAGRLSTVAPLNFISGVSVIFYDAGVVISGGPFSASGHKLLGALPANTFGISLGPMEPIRFEVPFQSGLAVAVRSGCAGFSVTWVPEFNPNTGTAG